MKNTCNTVTTILVMLLQVLSMYFLRFPNENWGFWKSLDIIDILYPSIVSLLICGKPIKSV